MLTPVDIDNIVFKKSAFGGYDIKEVEAFLEKVRDDYDIIYKEHSELKDKNINLQEVVGYYKSIEDGISQTVTNAQGSADDIIRNAEKEAETIIKAAEVEAKKRIEQINVEIQRKESEFEDKKKQIQMYRIRIEAMIQAQVKILEDISNENI